MIVGTGSAGACPSEQPKLTPLPIASPQHWTEYVDTPLTANELARVRMKRAGLA